MTVAETACGMCDTQLHNFALWPEELFVWSADILDDIKENGDEYMPKIDTLWKVQYSSLRNMDNSVPAEELQLAASMALDVPVLMLRASDDGAHRYMGGRILASVSDHYGGWEESFTGLAARCDRLSPMMRKWTNDFMALDNDIYLTDEVEGLLRPKPESGTKERKEKEDKQKTSTMKEEGKSTTINVTVNAGGEYVQEKHVGYQIGNVENGGIGIQVLNGTPKAETGKRGAGGAKVAAGVFTYKWAKKHPAKVTEFYQALVKLRAVDKDTDHEEFEKLFMGEPTDIIVKWTAPKSLLSFLMRTLKERGLISPPGRIWAIAQSHFKGTDNNLFADLRNQHNPESMKRIVEAMADTLDPRKDAPQIDTLDDGAAEELWASMKDRGWDW